MGGGHRQAQRGGTDHGSARRKLNAKAPAVCKSARVWV